MELSCPGIYPLFRCSAATQTDQNKNQQFKPYKLNKTVLSFLFYTGVPEHLRTVESNVLHAADTAALDYRSTQMAQCSMTGVAGALIAQITNSSLQLQYMLTVNPIVPALCTSSLVIALLCVYYSFRMHYSLAKCTFAEDLRTAFTERIPVGTRGGCGEGGPGSGEGGEETGVSDRRLEEGIAEPIEEGGGRILASYKATLMLWLPLYLLVLAISSYLVTIFLYWGFAAGMDLEGRRKESTVVSFHVSAPPLVSRADNEFLGRCTNRVLIVGGWISMDHNRDGKEGLSSLHSGAVRQS